MDDKPAMPAPVDVEALKAALDRATDVARLLGDDPIEAIRLSLHALTAKQWFGLLTGDPEGVLPPCCAEISDLRDQLVALARMPTVHGAAAAVRSIFVDLETHGVPGELVELARALIDVLNVARPGWLETDLGVPDPERELVMRAHLELTGHYGPDSTYEPRPREEWSDGLRNAMRLVRDLVTFYILPESKEWSRQLAEVDSALVYAMRAGAPLQVLLSLHAAARGLRPSDG